MCIVAPFETNVLPFRPIETPQKVPSNTLPLKMNGWRGWISAVDIGGPVVPSAANYNIPSAPPWAVVVVRGLGRHAISCQIGAPDYDRFHPRL